MQSSYMAESYGCTMQSATVIPNNGLEHFHVSLCVEWLKFNALVESVSILSTVLLPCMKKSLGDTQWGERPMAVSFRLATSSRQICLREGRAGEEKGRGNWVTC